MLLISLLVLLYPRVEFVNDVGLVGENYTPNIKTYNMFKDISGNTKIKGNVDINKVGKYIITSETKYLFLNIKNNFEVNIVDNISPVITLKGNNPSIACPNKEYVEEGYDVTDNYDKDFTDKVKITKNTDSIVYQVIDSSNNISEVERKVIYEDKELPVLTLNGYQTISLYLGNAYYEPGYSAIDNCDGDITSNVTVSGGVDTSKVGTYKIYYQVTDSSNNTVTQERTVVVRKKLNSYGNGKIYLTFDDGPSHLTGRILDILDSEGVKATFFVVGANEYTKRAYNSGHTIALHSNTHNYGYIYSSVDNYFNDLKKIENKVYNLIGVKSNIIRFPGGSSNTISRNYNVGIMTRLTGEVLNRGYIYYDWNVDSNDAGGAIYNSQSIYYNVVNNLSHSKTNIVLMHDSGGHDATVNALKNIITYGKTYGYTFEAITESTPVVAHPINN